MLPSAALNTFPAANAANNIRLLLLYHGAKRRLRRRWTFSQQPTSRLSAPSSQTAPRQLQSKSQFFAPCISQKDSQWRQRRHVKIDKKLFFRRTTPKRNSSLCNRRHTLLIDHTKPDAKKKFNNVLQSSAASNFVQRLYCLRRRQALFLVSLTILPPSAAANFFLQWFSRLRRRQIFFGTTVPPSAAPKSENGAGWIFIKNAVFRTLQAKKGLVLHVLCPSHPCASLARTVLKPLSFLAPVWITIFQA